MPFGAGFGSAAQAGAAVKTIQVARAGWNNFRGMITGYVIEEPDEIDRLEMINPLTGDTVSVCDQMRMKRVISLRTMVRNPIQDRAAMVGGPMSSGVSFSTAGVVVASLIAGSVAVAGEPDEELLEAVGLVAHAQHVEVLSGELGEDGVLGEGERL